VKVCDQLLLCGLRYMYLPTYITCLVSCASMSASCS